MYRTLLTGGTGFIGNSLFKYLGVLGYEVENISKQEFMYEDMGRLDRFQPDVLIHCAWPKLSLQKTDHLEFAEMSCNLFNECKKRGIRVINLGSSSEYGVQDSLMREDMICEPVSTYGIAKLMVTLYAKKLGFNTLRLFTVTGGKKNFLDNIDKTKWSDRYQVRHYVSIDLVCLAVQRLLHAEHLYGEIINVASRGSQKTNLEIASIYSEPIQSDEELVSDRRWNKYPQTQYEPARWEADITKMQKLLNI